MAKKDGNQYVKSPKYFKNSFSNKKHLKFNILLQGPIDPYEEKDGYISLNFKVFSQKKKL